jgi:hypothetical protein
MTPKIRPMVDLSRLSPALKVLELETSCVCRINITHLSVGSQEQPSNRMSLLEEAETMTSGSRVILVKGVAWKTYA